MVSFLRAAGEPLSYFMTCLIPTRAQFPASVASSLVTLKYGPPTPSQRARLEAMKTEHLSLYIERVLTASTLEELLAGPS